MDELTFVRCCKCCLMLVLFCHLSPTTFASLRDDTPEKFTINLDDPPSQRWMQIGKHFSSQSKNLMHFLETFIGSPWKLKLLTVLAEAFHGSMVQPYKDEITGLAKGMNLSIGDTVVTNLFYSATANRRHGQKMCTSIVAVDKQGSILHARNLDYSFKKLLKNATVTIEFQRKGETVYTATGFVGQIGLFTVQKPNAFTVTLDERHTGEWWMAVIEMLKDGKNAHLPSFLIRDVIEQESTFDAAVTRLSTARQLAPSYYIVGGLKGQEGAIVTHGRWKTPDVYFLNQTQEKWFLVETNYDHWTTPPPHDDRRDVAIKELLKVGQENISLDALRKVLSVPPVQNKHTIYTTLMSASEPSSYSSYMH